MKKLLLWLIAIISIIFWASSSFATWDYTLEIDYPSTMYFSQTYDVTFTASVPIDNSIIWQTFNLNYGWVFEFVSWDFVEPTNQILYVRYTTPPASKMSEVTGLDCATDIYNTDCQAMNDFVFYSDMPITPTWWETLIWTNQMNMLIQLSPENMPTGAPMLNWKSVVDEMKAWETNNEVQVNWKTVIATLLILAPILLTMYFWRKLLAILSNAVSWKTWNKYWNYNRK